MKLLRLAAWTVWFMLSWVTLAHAGPLLGIFGAIGSLFGGGLIGQLVQWGLGVALRVGIGLLTRSKKTNQQAGISGQVQVGGDNPLSFIMGHFGTAGQLEYINTWGNVDKTPNAYLVSVISISDLPMALSGLWVDDKKVTLPDMSGTMPDEKGWPIPEFVVDGNPYLWVRFLDGSQTTADSYLLSKFGSDPDRPWQSDMIFRGVPVLIMTARAKEDLFNSYPKYIAESPGIRLYDLRKDSSVGGSGSHRWWDQSTWEPSDNNAVQAYNVLRGIYLGTDWVWGGRCEGWQLPAANWMAAANACDLGIPLSAGGTEAQFRAGSEIKVDQEPADVIDDLMKGCHGRIAEIGGIYKVSVGAPGAAIYSFTDEMIIVSESQSFDPFPGLENTYNAAQASYPEPGEKWAAKDAPAYMRQDLEVLDDDRRLVSGIQYPYTPYALQVQRLLKAAVEDSRRFRVHQIVLPPEAWLLEPNDIVAWTSGRFSYTDKKFIVVEVEGDSNFLQYVTLKEVDPADFVWNPLTDEKPYSIGNLGPIVPPIQAFVGWQVAPYVTTKNGKQMPGILVRYPGDLDDVQMVRIQVRFAGSAFIEVDGVYPYGDPAKNDNPVQRVLENIFLPDEDYEVRGLFIPFSSRRTDWSTWLAVKTPKVWMRDLYPVDIERLAADVRAYQQWVSGSLRDALEELRAVSALVADQSMTNYTDKQTLRQEAASTTQNNRAYVRKSIITATGPNSALALSVEELRAEVFDPVTGLPAVAQAVTSLSTRVDTVDGVLSAHATAISALETEVDGVISSVNVRGEAQSSPGGGWARWGVQVKTGSGDTWSTSSFFLDAKPGQSRTVFVADQTIFMSGSGQTANVFLFDANGAYLNVANIGTVNAGVLQSTDGKFKIDLNNKYWVISE
jgi:hypothetical protein